MLIIWNWEQQILCLTRFFYFICESVLSDPVKRREYDKRGMLYVYDYHITVSASPLSLR